MGLPSYSMLFACLHDEPQDYGSLGRGTHYSIMRAAAWLGADRKPLPIARMQDFAVVWDEDHDTRVIEAIEQMYVRGLLSPVLFIGERKGGLTVIVSSEFYFAADIAAYQKEVSDIAQASNDPWHVMVGRFDRETARRGDWGQLDPEGIINDDAQRVNIYLANIDVLWDLGMKAYRPPAHEPEPWPSVVSVGV